MAKPTYANVKAALDSGKTLQQLAKTYKKSFNSMRAWWAAQNSKHVKAKRGARHKTDLVLDIETVATDLSAGTPSCVYFQTSGPFQSDKPTILPFTPENFNKVLDRYEEAAKPAATAASDDAIEWTRLVWQGMLVDAQMLQPGHTLTRQRVRMMLEAAEKAKDGKV